MKTTQLVRTLLVMGAFASALPPTNAAEIISNGGFESAFTGWTRADQSGSDGTFFLQTGTASPVNGDPVAAPPGPTHAAMTDAQGPGTHVLYQDFLVSSPVASALLSFDAFLGNRAGAFFVPNPASLDFAAAAFNQQARVDILLGAASAFSVAGGDVLLNLWQTNPGDPLVSGYSAHAVEIAALLDAHLNTPLRLRWAETDNVSTFQFGVDNVSLLTSPVPEPSSWASGSMGVLLGGAYLGLRRRKNLPVTSVPIGNVISA